MEAGIFTDHASPCTSRAVDDAKRVHTLRSNHTDEQLRLFISRWEQAAADRFARYRDPGVAWYDQADALLSGVQASHNATLCRQALALPKHL